MQWVDRVRLFVQDIPQQKINTLAVDHFQPQTWYAGSGAELFRSLNDGDGWELSARFDEEEVQVVAAHPQRKGLVAVVTAPVGEQGTRIYFSRDCGEAWSITPIATAFSINDIAWTLRDGLPWLLLATDVGLYEFGRATPRSRRASGCGAVGAGPVQVLVDDKDQDLGFYAVVTSWMYAGRSAWSWRRNPPAASIYPARAGGAIPFA